jgi:minor extracellular serine protease Vpr
VRPSAPNRLPCSNGIRATGGDVAGSVENVLNALLVHIPDDRAGRLIALPGVRQVYAVYSAHALLDHALPLHHVPDAWARIGGADNAGAGIKIGIIDSGIDISHPGFRDAGFVAPDGFPRADNDDDLAYTNQKVIVARNYLNLIPGREANASAADHDGHGTAVAMAAAGVSNTGPYGAISGVAPRAFLGSYKVLEPNFGTTESIIKGIDEAVADGMDVLNLSLGGYTEVPLTADAMVRAVENAVSAGVVVVAGAGNNGPDPMTVFSPASAPSAIAVGAIGNDRAWMGRLMTDGGAQFLASPKLHSTQSDPVTGRLLDATTFDPAGQLCDTPPKDSAAGAILLIFRGACTLESKLNNAGAAGATAAVIYDNVAGETPFTFDAGTATLPGLMISYDDGIALKAGLSGPVQATLQFQIGPLPIEPRLMQFSSIGPNLDLSIKPDVVAVGANLSLAVESSTPGAELYSQTGYAVELRGTSFAAPLVSGAAALVKSARPGLSVEQYRSLLVNTANPGRVAHVQQAGGGALDVAAALDANAAVMPVSLVFGGFTPSLGVIRELKLWNLGASSESFHISVAPLHGDTLPQVPSDPVDVEPGVSGTIPVQFAADQLAPGEYDGFIVIEGARSAKSLRVPYWYGYGTGPRHVTLLINGVTAPAGSTVFGFSFRVTDEAGLPVLRARATVEPISGGGDVIRVVSIADVYEFAVQVRLGATPGLNIFRIHVGDISADAIVLGQ